MRIASLAVLFVLAVNAFGQGFPPGTATFFDTNATVAVPALGGGIWVGTENGITHYTAAGAGATYALPFNQPPRALALAADGSIWFATDSWIGRISPGGVLLEQYLVGGAHELAVATDGALWYKHWSTPGVGRISGSVTEFPEPVHAWNLAPAAGGDMWILGTGLALTPDSLWRVTPAGAVTEFPLGRDVLFGHLQTIADGRLYLQLGVNGGGILRLAPNGQILDNIHAPGTDPIRFFVADAVGNLWTGGYGLIAYLANSGSPRLTVPMPNDTRDCVNKAVYLYRPLAIDSGGGVWFQVEDDSVFNPFFPPCDQPAPTLPDLIRVDGAQVLAAAHAAHHTVPALSPAMLLTLAVALAGVAMWAVRLR